MTQRHNRQTESKQSEAEIKQRSHCVKLSQRQTERQNRKRAAETAKLTL